MPPTDGQSVKGADGEKIMHVGLPISKETSLMGSDVLEGYGPPFIAGNNFSVSISTDSTSNADNFFKKLSAGGTPVMPMNKTFWGSYFGMLVDKYGINWMISYDEAPQTQSNNKSKEASVA